MVKTMQIKTCRKKQHVRIGNMKEMQNLICGKAAVGGNYNSTRDTTCRLPVYEIIKKIANCLRFAIKRNIIKKKEEAISMARTANVFARVEPEVKEQAEQVLDRLGIPMSNAVGMFLRQIVLQRGIPFEMKLPAYEEPVAYGSLTKEQFNAEIEKGMEDIKAGRVYSADEVEAEMKREFGI